jgi:HEAT repeat protein
MQSLRVVVAEYVCELTGPRADDAFHSLLELGPAVLTPLQEAFHAARAPQVRSRVAEVICHIRSIDALPFLRELLQSRDAELWKIALDGLVMLGVESACRAPVLEILLDARKHSGAEKGEWIDEAMDQIRAGFGLPD